MPLLWKSGENPYRTNYFGVLKLGPGVPPVVINAVRKQLVTEIEYGNQHILAGRPLTEADVNEAAARMIEESSWAAEVLLVHQVPASGKRRLQQVCARILNETTQFQTEYLLPFANLHALSAWLPSISAEMVDWPAWAAFQICEPGSEECGSDDVQFDC